MNVSLEFRNICSMILDEVAEHPKDFSKEVLQSIKKRIATIKRLFEENDNWSWLLQLYHDEAMEIINVALRDAKLEYYTPTDNSYAQCLDDEGKNHCLVDSVFSTTPKLKVLVQPFKMRVFSHIKNEYRSLPFIIGLDESTGLRHLVLYYETSF